MRELLVTTTALLLLTLLGATAAGAQGSGALAGKWVETSEEAGEIYYAEFGGDGQISLDIYDVQYGQYIYDEKNHRLTVIDEDQDRDDIDDDSWVQVAVQGDKLTFTHGEDSVVFDRITHPEKPQSALVGRWEVNAEESSREAVGDDPDFRMFMTFNNDGSASYEELDEALKGTFTVDPEQGTIELTINDDTEPGTYKVEDGKLTLSFADETHVFDKAE